ncbi:hypothetical protein [Nitrospirillum viridazoti]|uniref:hypothetical protein n=1 Tax=Nitrospirillum viridazoti TaxID=3144925 RepID=UPI0011A7AA3D|nr:hypothetical protein [Nitrospirillum amazonense]
MDFNDLCWNSLANDGVIAIKWRHLQFIAKIRDTTLFATEHCSFTDTHYDPHQRPQKRKALFPAREEGLFGCAGDPASAAPFVTHGAARVVLPGFTAWR